MRCLALGLAALLLASPAPAWNYVTHRVIAAIAYDQLTPAARGRVDALIKIHPDYQQHFLKDAPSDEAARARSAFIEAAIWADTLRNDPRFYDETLADATPTPTLPGFSEMGRHTGWHFIHLPFSQDGTPLEPAEVPNVVTALDRLMAEFARPDLAESQRAYDLVWLIHLFGDIHEPLHCADRFSASLPKGDLSGNLVFVASGNSPITLHKFWDDAVGADTSPGWVGQTVQEIEKLYPAPRSLALAGDSGSPESWAQESLSITKKDVYTFGTENGSREVPIHLPLGYQAHAQQIGQSQAATAASRLAAFLNLRLK